MSRKIYIQDGIESKPRLVMRVKGNAVCTWKDCPEAEGPRDPGQPQSDTSFSRRPGAGSKTVMGAGALCRSHTPGSDLGLADTVHTSRLSRLEKHDGLCVCDKVL